MVAFTDTRLNTIPRSLPVIQFFLIGCLLIGGRLVRAGLARRDLTEVRKLHTQVDENIIIVGANHVATLYTRLIEKCGLGRQRVLAVVDPNPRFRNQTVAGHRVIGTPEDLPAILDEYKTHGVEIHKFVVTIERSQLSQTALQCLCADISVSQPIDVEFLVERRGFATKDFAPEQETEAVVGPEVDRSVVASGHRGYWAVKRAVDIMVAASLLVVLSPTLLITALMVRVTIGSPVIFWQRRVGRLGGGIFILKFRTMNAPFDAHGNFRERYEEPGSIGALLRHIHVDELPQLFNILRGDMSLIGPRLLLPEDQPSDNQIRLLVRPGITGWAQVNGGNLITTEKKNALDEYYVRHASLWLDAKIVLKTVPIIFTGDRLPDDDDGMPARSSRQLRRV
jgi:lipopolysaccharide/colanic/teichoic acid biosynthesis glycosyltransferase